MIINHEVPLCLLEDSLEFNEYDFILPIFYKKYEQYRNFYTKCKKQNRFSILDCGLFEGDILPESDLLNIIQELRPNLFIVPDVWNSADLTLRNAKYWMNNYKDSLPYPTELMVVLQGETYYNIKALYQHCLDLGYTNFAFNHSSVLYQNLFPHQNKLISQMMGRISVISKLFNEGMIRDSHYVHLLGCSLPQEFMYYEGYDFIKSLDTSNPIIRGAKGELYDFWKSFTKPTEKIEEFMDKQLSKHIKDMIEYNVRMFRKYIYNQSTKLINA